jgi:NAD(P)-dependent dehydrogenase (short-subunit alcohol dehydrogenase family)
MVRQEKAEDMGFDFNNKVVMVTGATGNLGASVARAFLANGANLALIDRGADRLREAYPELADSKDHYLGNCADLTNPEDVNDVVQQTVAHFGYIHILVHTVGGYRAGEPLHATSIDTWNFMIDLNARSTFIVCHAVIPHMLSEGKGKIVTIGARPGLRGSSNASAYGAAKSAVIRLTESMAAEYKGQGINVNCVIPGTIDTPENREAMPDADHSSWVTPGSLANAILFLASQLARDVHGAVIPVLGRS